MESSACHVCAAPERVSAPHHIRFLPGGRLLDVFVEYADGADGRGYATMEIYSHVSAA
jgi:hypothetical protein